MRSAPFLAAALAFALAAGPALAQPAPAPAPAAPADPQTITDVRCILVAGSLSQSTDPDLQKLGQVSLLYFLGRIDGRGASANLATMIADEAAKMSADDIKAQAQTCGAIFTAASQSLQDLGTALQQKQAATPPK
jgi:hypothetical protein